ncbi:hypothetical protein D3C86_2048900 [compost metagenome]
MQIPSISVEDYISQIPEERQEVFKKMFDTVNDNLPQGFKQGVSYGMIGWNVENRMEEAGIAVKGKGKPAAGAAPAAGEAPAPSGH